MLASWAAAEVTVVGDLARPFQAQPGEIVHDQIEIRNNGTSAAEVRVYLTDYSFAAAGSNSYPAAGTLPRSNGQWISLSAVPTLVPAGESITLPYSITIPSEDLQGSYWSMIMVEGVAPTTEGAGTVVVRTQVRFGVQVITTIGGESRSELLFENPTLTGGDGDVSRLTVDIRNSGTKSLLARHYVDLFDAQGNQLARVEGSKLRTYPGTSVRQSFQLGQLQAGSYVAIVVADGGGNDVFGAQYNLNVDE